VDLKNSEARDVILLKKQRRRAATPRRECL